MWQKLAILKYIITVATHLKWAWNYLLYKPFNFSCQNDFPMNIPVGGIGIARHFRHDGSHGEEAENECSICLCKIEEEQEVEELSCDHIFHKVCLDRWVVYGNITCPICRNYLRLPPSVAEVHHELLLFKFCSFGSSERESWWLR